MTCKKCKKEIPDNSKFCNLCGTNQTIKTRNVKSRGNGQGTVFKTANGKYKVEVVLYYYVVDGKTKKKVRTATFDKKTDAINAISILRNKETVDNHTIFNLYQIFIDTEKYKNLSKSQQDKLRFAWNKIISLHNKKIVDVTFSDMQDLIKEVAPTHDTAKDIKALLCHLYDIAIKREWCDINKAKKLEIPPAPIPKRQVYSDEELHKFWCDYKNGSVFTGYILLMSYVGLRYGELADIKKENVYLDKKYMIGGIKTDAGKNRELAIADCILPIVTHFYNTGKNKLIEISKKQFYKLYWETIERLGIRKLPPQTGRHTYFTKLARAGVQTSVITEAGGHANFNTTLKNYVRIPIEDKIDAVNKIRVEIEKE